MLSERLARWQFWLLYIGFILTFGPMHVAGILGMPRRIYTYDADRGWAIWNQLTTIGALIQVPSFAIFVVQRGLVAAQRPAGWRRSVECLDAGVDDEFAAALLQLRDRSRSSRSRRPLWDLKHPDDPDWRIRVKPRAPGKTETAKREHDPRVKQDSSSRWKSGRPADSPEPKRFECDRVGHGRASCSPRWRFSAR